MPTSELTASREVDLISLQREGIGAHGEDAGNIECSQAGVERKHVGKRGGIDGRGGGRGSGGQSDRDTAEAIFDRRQIGRRQVQHTRAAVGRSGNCDGEWWCWSAKGQGRGADEGVAPPVRLISFPCNVRALAPMVRMPATLSVPRPA